MQSMVVYMYAKRVAAETETEETAYPQEKDRMKQTTSKSKTKKGRKRRKTYHNTFIKARTHER